MRILNCVCIAEISLDNGAENEKNLQLPRRRQSILDAITSYTNGEGGALQRIKDSKRRSIHLVRQNILGEYLICE